MAASRHIAGRVRGERGTVAPVQRANARRFANARHGDTYESTRPADLVRETAAGLTQLGRVRHLACLHISPVWKAYDFNRGQPGNV